jgi:DNA-binding NarL/FixJ family response regulator
VAGRKLKCVSDVDHAAPIRVLLGNLEPMVRLGITGILEQSGAELVTDDGRQSTVAEQAGRLRPDAVVLGLDDAETLTLREQVREAAPDAKLILWALKEDEMQVFDPGSSTPRLIRTAVPEALRSELTLRHEETEGE